MKTKSCLGPTQIPTGMNFLWSTLRIIGALILIALLVFFGLFFINLFLSKDEIVLFNNTEKTVHVCALAQHDSDCNTIVPKQKKSFNMEGVIVLEINEEQTVNLRYGMLLPSLTSKVYCTSKSNCMHAFQLENNNKLYMLNQEQVFPVGNFITQRDGFPLEVYTLGYNKAKQTTR